MIDHGLLIFTQLILHLVKMDFVVLCEGEMSNYLYVIKQAMDILIGKGKAKKHANSQSMAERRWRG